MTIKISAMIGTPELTQPAMAIYQGDLAAAFRAVAALGYDGVELMTKDPTRLDGPAVRQLLEEHGLALAGLCTGMVYGEDGLGLVGPDLEIDRAAMERLRCFIDWARYFGPGACVNLGRARGMGKPDDAPGTLARMEEAFRALAEYAAPAGVQLMLEPINVLQATFIHTTQDGLDMIRRVNHPNFGLMLDVYHMNIEDVDICESLREAAGHFQLVHLTDNNRHWPGSAHLDFPRIIDVLNQTGYNGFVSLEILPWPDADTAARSSISYLRRYIPRQ